MGFLVDADETGGFGVGATLEGSNRSHAAIEVE